MLDKRMLHKLLKESNPEFFAIVRDRIYIDSFRECTHLPLVKDESSILRHPFLREQLMPDGTITKKWIRFHKIYSND